MLWGMRRSIGIPILLLVLGVVPLGGLGVTSMIRSTGELTRQVFSQLEGLREIKKAQIQRFFDERRSDLDTLILCIDRFRHDALLELSAIHEARKAALESGFRSDLSKGSTKRINFAIDNLSALTPRHRSRVILSDDDVTPSIRNNRKASPELDLVLGGIGSSVGTPFLVHSEGAAGNKAEFVLIDRLDLPPERPLYLETRTGWKETLIHESQEPTDGFFQGFVKEKGYYDLLLIDPDGEVLFSAARESDYGTNMLTGRYADSSLGKLVRKILETGSTGMADFEPYAPSGNEPAAFIARPFASDNGIELIVALQLSVDAINRIMLERTGLGKTGETYLVGPDLLMRSDSHLDPLHHSLKASFADPEQGKVDTEATREALAGIKGEKIIVDYNGNPVLSAYTPVRLWDVTWALVAEMDSAEAFESANRLTWIIGIVAVLSIGAIIAVALLIVLLLLNRTHAASP